MLGLVPAIWGDYHKVAEKHQNPTGSAENLGTPEGFEKFSWLCHHPKYLQKQIGLN